MDGLKVTGARSPICSRVWLRTPTAVTSPGAMAAVTARPPSAELQAQPCGFVGPNGVEHPADRGHADVGRLALGQEELFEAADFPQRPGAHKLIVTDRNID